MSDPVKDLLERALEHAVQEHFCKLFGVLMAERNQDTFEKGLHLLVRMEAMAGVMIAELE